VLLLQFQQFSSSAAALCPGSAVSWAIFSFACATVTACANSATVCLLCSSTVAAFFSAACLSVTACAAWVFVKSSVCFNTPVSVFPLLFG
jgi:hypothetical protein